MTYIELADTALKIGLGSAITAIATHLNSRSSHKRELQKEARTGIRKSLDEIVNQTEVFSNAVLAYWAMISEWSVKQLKNEELTPDRQSKLDAVQANLWPAYQSLTIVEARLLLLGEDRAQKLCRDYGELMTKFSKEAWPGGTPLSRENLQDWRTKLLTARTSFYKSLSEKYNASNA